MEKPVQQNCGREARSPHARPRVLLQVRPVQFERRGPSKSRADPGFRRKLINIPAVFTVPSSEGNERLGPARPGLAQDESELLY